MYAYSPINHSSSVPASTFGNSVTSGNAVTMSADEVQPEGHFQLKAIGAATTPINKASVVYGYSWSYADASYAANNFDILVVDFQDHESTYPYAQYMQNIKNRNPTIGIFGYKDLIGMNPIYEDWAEVNAHEDWFVHDADGNRVKNNVWGWYLMDVGNAGWREHWASYVRDKMSTYTAYDGAYADDVWDTLYVNSFDHTPPDSVAASWHADTLGMLQYIKANINGKLLLINTEAGWMFGHINSDYLDVVDGMEIEGYFHAPWEDSQTYSRVIESQIACLAQGSSEGKIMIAESGSSIPDDRLLKWTYATFVLGANGSNAYWGWNVGSFYTLDSVNHPITETNLGSPIGAYYKSQNVDMRDFTGGKVLSNPSDTPQFVDLGGIFWFPNNTIVSNLILGGYSGEVLLNAPVPTPTIPPTPTVTITPIPTLHPSSSPTISASPSSTTHPTLTPSQSSSPTLNPSPSQSPPLTPSASSSPNQSPDLSPTPTLTPKPSQTPDYRIAVVVLLPASALVLLVAVKRKKLPWVYKRARTILSRICKKFGHN
jgi:hypothetical protein